MSISYADKLKAIRKHERLTQAGFADLTGVSLGAIKNYESGHSEIGLSILERVVSNHQLSRYTLWLMTNQTAEESGQIAPDAKFLSSSTISKKKTA